MNVWEFYRQRLQQLEQELAVLQQKKSRLEWLRLFTIVAGLTLTWVFRAQGWPVVLLLVLATIISFGWAVARDLANSSLISHTAFLVQLNKTELRALDYDYLSQPDGINYLPPLHPYAQDLDLFGRASLFQFVNRAVSEQGQSTLADWFCKPASPATINERQAAVKELATHTNWRQDLQAAGMSAPLRFQTAARINKWMAEPNSFTGKIFWQVVRFLFPAISIGLVAAYSAGYIPTPPFLFFITVMIALSYLVTRQVMPLHVSLNRIAPELASLSRTIQQIEQGNFQSSELRAQQAIFGTAGHPASARIRSLGRILERLDLKLNFIVHIPLNTLLCWDLQQALALERWKKNNEKNIAGWFSTLGIVEALSSLANLHHNMPDWVFPAITDKPLSFDAVNLGHPLLHPAKRVCSSFRTPGPAHISLVTGSNMAGKSTFLRSIGVNIVLAWAGAPVCASTMSVSYLEIMSSMRIADNLEESTSTFYAELKKLKSIIDAVNEQKPVFLLLDEILRGTNSKDRHTGSAALIRQLIRHQAAGVIATHDLELAQLEKEFPGQLENYHFDVQVEKDELYFDYQLKNGICTSMNASILMRKIGIEELKGD